MTRHWVSWAALLAFSAAVGVLNRVTAVFSPGRSADSVNTSGALVQSLLVLGVATMSVYLVLGVLGTGVGAPTDIGGGLIVVAS